MGIVTRISRWVSKENIHHKGFTTSQSAFFQCDCGNSLIYPVKSSWCMFSLFPQSVIHAKTPNPPASDLVKTLFSNMYDLFMYTELSPWRWSFVPDRVTFVSIQKASGCQVNLVIDAEQSYLQLAIDNITIDLMRVFNKRRPVISNTYQNYLKVIGHLTLAAITGTTITVSNFLVQSPPPIWILQTSLAYFNWDSAEFLQLFLLMDHIYIGPIR